jgi:transcription initiation factor TFIIA large subunit
VAQMPWDPTPVPQVPAATVPSNAPKQEESPIQSAGSNPPPQIKSEPQTGNYGNVRIKTEPGYESSGSNFNGASAAYSSGLDRDIAQQRAQAILQRDFGAQVSSIPAMAARSNITLPGQRPMGLQLPGQGQTQRPSGALPPQQQQATAQQQRQPNGVYAAQTDGADEWDAIVAAKLEQGDDGPSGRYAVDRMLRRQLDEMSHRLDSGLMVPLDELKTPIKHKTRAKDTNMVSIPQFDGLGLDDEDDKKEIPDDEAINSELDDTDDELEREGDEDEDIGDTMLCTYDKVQRVKNKWKCTLKDGILTANGKE